MATLSHELNFMVQGPCCDNVMHHDALNTLNDVSNLIKSVNISNIAIQLYPTLPRTSSVINHIMSLQWWEHSSDNWQTCLCLLWKSNDMKDFLSYLEEYAVRFLVGFFSSFPTCWSAAHLRLLATQIRPSMCGLRSSEGIVRGEHVTAGTGLEHGT